MAGLNFDARTVDPQEAFEPLPTGWYNAQITESEMKPTAAGTGSYLQLVLTVLDGAMTGRKVWDRLNLQNPNPVAVEIAYKTLSAICHATGIMQVQDSQQLHNIPIMVRVVLKPAKGEYDASNDIKGYKAFGSDAQAVGGQSAPPMGQQTQPQATPQQAPQQDNQPWNQQQQHHNNQQPPQQSVGFQQPAQDQGQDFQAPPQQHNEAANQGGGQQFDPNAGNQNAPAGGGQQPPWNEAPDQSQQPPQQTSATPPWGNQQ